MSDPRRTFVVRARRVVAPGAERPACVLVQAGRIAAVLDWDDAPAGIECHRLPDDVALMPGLVDTHVHVNEPGRTDWEGFASATRAAAAGGVTTLVDMPLNSVPATLDAPAVEAKVRALAGNAIVDVALWGGAVPANAERLEPLASAGVLGFKSFLSPSGVAEFAHVDADSLEQAVASCAALGLPLLVHAEDPAELRPPHGDPRRHATWAASRPAAAEAAAIARVGALAARHDARVHVVHVASGAALEALADARAAGARLSAETCPHYLTLDGEAVPDGATAYKCAPPLRDAAEREALWRALESGALAMVVSDHSPSPPGLKQLESGDFLAAWGGIASLELALAVTWTGARARGHTLGKLARWTSAAPAALAGLAAHKGAIAPGYDADLVAFAPDASFAVDAAVLHQRHPVTPYHGATLHGRVHATWARGVRVWSAADGEFAAPAGRWLRRGPTGVQAVDPAAAFE